MTDQDIDALCDRLDAVNPWLAAFVDEPGRRARLLEQARELRTRHPGAGERPALFGMPVAVKDVLHVDGLPTRGGARLPASVLAGAQGTAVSRLRAAGALVLGKSVTAEFAFLAPGPTVNPHNPRHTPGGSSSGSAAAVAAGLAPLGLGTQTIGSVIRPAAFCGIVGFKPGYGRIPADGLLYNAPSFDTVGVLAADLDVARLAARTLCDTWSDATPERSPVLGVPEGPYLDQAEPSARAAFDERVRGLAAAGYVVRRVPLFADIAEINARHRLINRAELARVHRAWHAEYGHAYAEATTGAIAEGRRIPEAAYRDACAARTRWRAELADATEDAGVDVWLSPAATGPAPDGLSSTGDPAMNVPWTQAGWPVLTVPAGHAPGGLPLGLQCAATPGADERLLAWATGIAAG